MVFVATIVEKFSSFWSGIQSEVIVIGSASVMGSISNANNNGLSGLSNSNSNQGWLVRYEIKVSYHDYLLPIQIQDQMESAILEPMELALDLALEMARMEEVIKAMVRS